MCIGGDFILIVRRGAGGRGGVPSPSLEWASFRKRNNKKSIIVFERREKDGNGGEKNVGPFSQSVLACNLHGFRLAWLLWRSRFGASATRDGGAESLGIDFACAH